MFPKPTGQSDNISTEHQPDGDAMHPSDTLDRPDDKVHPPRDFDPVQDVGRPQPGVPAGED